MSFGFNFFDDNEAEKDGSTWYSSINDDCAKLSGEILEFPLPQEESRATDFEPILIEGITFHRILRIDSNKYQEDSDLIPGVYEGGFKVWECTMDTIKYLQNTPHLLSRISGASILDLGCGHGFLGIYCLMNNATKVSFSDFNEEVIRGPTCQNILRNCPLQSAKAVCQAGDWLQLHNKLTARNEKFHVILTAETIYNEDCCKKVLFMINEHLQDGGFALVATKRFYFGVGGGSATLEQFICSLSSLSLQLVWSIEDGSSNIRDLFLITKKMS